MPALVNAYRPFCVRACAISNGRIITLDYSWSPANLYSGHNADGLDKADSIRLSSWVPILSLAMRSSLTARQTTGVVCSVRLKSGDEVTKATVSHADGGLALTLLV